MEVRMTTVDDQESSIIIAIMIDKQHENNDYKWPLSRKACSGPFQFWWLWQRSDSWSCIHGILFSSLGSSYLFCGCVISFLICLQGLIQARPPSDLLCSWRRWTQLVSWVLAYQVCYSMPGLCCSAWSLSQRLSVDTGYWLLQANRPHAGIFGRKLYFG